MRRLNFMYVPILVVVSLVVFVNAQPFGVKDMVKKSNGKKWKEAVRSGKH